jgi:hypothetical protein
MRKNPRRILSPQRLPFRHPGAEPLSYIVFNELAARRFSAELRIPDLLVPYLD